MQGIITSRVVVKAGERTKFQNKRKCYSQKRSKDATKFGITFFKGMKIVQLVKNKSPDANVSDVGNARLSK